MEAQRRGRGWKDMEDGTPRGCRIRLLRQRNYSSTLLGSIYK